MYLDLSPFCFLSPDLSCPFLGAWPQCSLLSPVTAVDILTSIFGAGLAPGGSKDSATCPACSVLSRVSLLSHCRTLHSTADCPHPVSSIPPSTYSYVMSCQGTTLNNTQDTPDKNVLCYNKGCGERFLPDTNTADSCLFHPGYPIFHDALKGWSCCRKRTTDFSEFLAIKGCTKGFHSNEKPAEPLKPDISGSKNGPGSKSCTEIIVQGPKSAEKMQKERPRTTEEMNPLLLKVSRFLEQELEKLTLESDKGSEGKVDSPESLLGRRCKHSGCKEVYQGPETDEGVCVHHSGVPVFHEGMKYWSCCAIKTSDFNEFLEQKGCSSGKHLWIVPREKQNVSCRYDWHQTSSLVVITVYAKTALPDLSKVLANRTQLDIQIAFQGKKEFRKQLELWGVIDTDRCFVNMLATKVEITLKKSDPVTWARLELTVTAPPAPNEPEPKEPTAAPVVQTDDISDDDLSWSEDEDICD
ncbi:integrin beta-1-binding protein 2 isoform X2 [Leptodactylus fuscus]|uniref:integrin beta-1-binding protein 2 isoform X2 n=1 Tax=Leptodactylus fuscus TaxID=238119 RepID=UPI003F4EF4F1